MTKGLLADSRRLMKKMNANKIRLSKLRDAIRSDFDELENLLASVDEGTDSMTEALDSLNRAIDTLSQQV